MRLRDLLGAGLERDQDLRDLIKGSSAKADDREKICTEAGLWSTVGS